MFLNSDNQKIVDYLKLNSLENFAEGYITFLGSGNKLLKSELKIILKSIRKKDKQFLTKKLLEIFKNFDISLPDEISKKEAVKNSSTSRVKKHREINKLKGFKNLSLLLPPDEYQKLRELKIKKQMTYSELIIFLLETAK